MTNEGIIKNPELETKIRKSLNYGRSLNTIRCYEFSRKLSKQSDQFQYSDIKVRDGLAIYDLELLLDLTPKSNSFKNPVEIIRKNTLKFKYIILDHSWGEMLEERLIIDYIPFIRLPEGIVNFDLLIMTNMDVQNESIQYLPIGKEIAIFNSKYIYIPLGGSKIGPFQLPKIVRLQ